VKSCGSAALCDAASGRCNTCVPGAYACQNGTELHRCSADGQTNPVVDTCATPALCNPAGPACTAPACGPGDYRCTGQVLEVCNADRTGFTGVKTCGEPTPVCSASARDCVAAPADGGAGGGTSSDAGAGG
jgi:hypothetical protein